jgi:hypothetical protein
MKRLLCSRRFDADGIAAVRMNGLQTEVRDSLKKKLQEGVLATETVDCLICGG